MGSAISAICLPLNDLLLNPLKELTSNSIAFVKEKVTGDVAGQALLLKDKAEEVAALKDKAEEVSAFKDKIEGEGSQAVTGKIQEAKDLLENVPSPSDVKNLVSDKASDLLGKKLSLF